MSGTTISSADTVGIVLTAASQSPLTIAATGSVYVVGYYGSGIYSGIDAPATIVNLGAVYGAGYGVNLHDGGTITNGSAAQTSASLTGGYEGVLVGARGPAAITNFGTIASTNRTSGIGIMAGGAATVGNGAANDSTALIVGYFDGVFVGGAASVTNFGTIAADGTSTELGNSSIGIYLRAGGAITNGGLSNTSASVTGVAFGIEVSHVPGTVNNFGTIDGTGPIGRGIVLVEGGTVVNGAAQDSSARIIAQAKNGVYCGGTAASTVTNLGTIIGGKNGVALQSGGTVINGGRSASSALISGARQGIYIEGLLPAFVANTGTILSTGGFWGISIYLRGAVANGGPTNTAALIGGSGGIYDGGAADVLNYGTISGTTRPGLDLKAGGVLIDYGAVISNSGTAVYFGNGNSRLEMAPSAKFTGIVQAGTGSNVLELLAGGSQGTLSGLGSAFVHFGTVEADAGGTWLLSGAASVADLTVNGTLTVAGSLDISGALAPAVAGVLTFASDATIEVASALGQGPDIRFLQDDTLVVDTGTLFGDLLGGGTPTGPELQNFGTNDTIDLRDLPLAGVIVLDYFSVTGELRVGHGSGHPVATLFFDPATLGAGDFHIGGDGAGGTLLTHN